MSDGVNDSVDSCPFKQMQVSADEHFSCRWRDEEGCCRYKADRKDLMKSLSLLSSKIFELSRLNNIPPDKSVEVCFLLNTANSVLSSIK